MATMRGPRLQVGSTAWVGEERSSALQIVQSEVEEFSFSVRNEVEWLNEHVAGIFNENEINFAETFKTPGKLRGRTPHTARKVDAGLARPPLSNIFASTPNGASPKLNRMRSPIQEDSVKKPTPTTVNRTLPSKPEQQSQQTQDSGYATQSQKHQALDEDHSYVDMDSSPMLLGGREQVSKVAVKDSPTKTGVLESPGKTSDNLEPEADDDMEASPDKQLHDEQDIVDERDQDDAPSEASSPVRNIGRKSSLNFASLPAREPLTAGKTLGGRTSRISYAKPPPQYPRLGSDRVPGSSSRLENSESLQPVESSVERVLAESAAPDAAKTYTQRLQDQIKQIKRSGQADDSPVSPPIQRPKSNAFASPNRKESIQIAMQTTPGAFPEDDDEEDDWIEPPTTARPELPKSYSADVMEGIRDKATIGQPDFAKNQDQRPGDTQRLFDKHDADLSSPVANRIPSVFSETALTHIVSNDGYLQTQKAGEKAPPSPTRSIRESPLKQMKSKLSSILKSSKSLLASSAAISAEGKSTMLTPSAARYGLNNLAGSTESLQTLQKVKSNASRTYDQLAPGSPTLTRSAAPEAERRTAVQVAAAEQMAKLERAREQEREKARVFSKEQERIAAMENEIANKKQVERKPVPSKEMPKTTRSSPRKVGTKEDETVDHDIAMHDVPPPSASKTPSAASHALRNREVKRPAKPTREPPVKAKLVPTVIRVNTGSQHSQYRPSSRQSTGQPEPAPVAAPQPQLAPKASKSTLQPKPSTQSLRSLSAAKKKEQEEREAQRKREAKAEADRKKVAAQEEQKKQEQRRIELERQKQKEREHADEKKNAARQAAIEKAKQTRAPPPAVRSQPNGPPDFSLSQQKQMLSSAQKPEAPGTRPPSRLAQASSSVVGGSKAAQKRPMNAEQAKDPKRRRTSETFDEASSSQHMKGPPVRPSPGFKKDIASKSLFQSGYSNAPASVTKDIFRASVVSHQGVQKGGHPLDIAQISKGGIPFAPNDNAPASAFKTPARPGQPLAGKSIAKPVSRPSPQFQNGESIDLPEILTDDEDEEDGPGMQVAPWADSPALKQALVYQETLDPSQIFGAPGPLVMEEVFSKNKERWGKFRARTSSANWSGLDRLTEDDVRKDMAAREKLRREGGWSYEMSRDML